jgi:hypothetical protein
MRLRQVALIAHRIAPVEDALERIFGLQVAYRDPAVGVFGLANIVMPVGGEFLEVLEPERPDASGARYLARRGGDAGYMVILQSDDALGHRARLEAAGVRVVAGRSEGRYLFSHFHPADTSAVLLSIDEVRGADWREPLGDWPPAGPVWRDHPSALSLGIAAVTLQARDPAAMAERWSMLLGRPTKTAGDDLEIALDAGVIRFVAPVDEDGTGVVGLDVIVADVEETLARAVRAGAPVTERGVGICGTALRPVTLSR